MSLLRAFRTKICPSDFARNVARQAIARRRRDCAVEPLRQYRLNR